MNLQLEYICISITSICNLNCKYCYRFASKRNKYMPREDFENILIKLKKLGYKKINLTGGEPLLHPNIKEFINIAFDLGFFIALSTNSILLELDNPIYKQVNIIDIPLDGVNSSINSLVRGNGQFEHAERVLNDYKFGNYPFFLKVNTVMTMYNYNNLLDIANMLYKNKVFWRIFFCRTEGEYNLIENRALVSSKMFLSKIDEINEIYPDLLMIEACKRDVENDLTFSIIDTDCNFIVSQGGKSEIIGNLISLSECTLMNKIK